MNVNVACVVVLYNPEIKSLLSNLENYLTIVKVLYIIDNSDHKIDCKLKSFIDSHCQIKYISLNGNKGIAYALNVGVNSAIIDDFKWVITMDQDSFINDHAIEKLYHYAVKIHQGNLGIVSALPKVHKNQPKSKVKFEYVNTTITSGSLMNTEAFVHVGGFEEKLFIDYVDNIYCFGLVKLGYDIVRCNDVSFEHSLGDIKQHKLCGKLVFVTHHNYIRRYYITRNRMYYQKLVGGNKLTDNFKDFFKILIFESDKFNKIKSFVKGSLDFYNNKFGRY